MVCFQVITACYHGSQSLPTDQPSFKILPPSHRAARFQNYKEFSDEPSPDDFFNRNFPMKESSQFRKELES